MNTKKLSKDKKAEIHKIFANLDVNGTGFLTARALSEKMRAYGHDHTEQEVQVMIDTFDTDGKGMMDCSMFSTAVLCKPDSLFIQKQKKAAKN